MEKHHKLQPKSKTTDQLKAALQTIWEELPQEHINKAVANFIKCLTVCMSVLWLSEVVISSICSKPLSISKSASSPRHQQTGSFYSEPPTDYW